MSSRLLFKILFVIGFVVAAVIRARAVRGTGRKRGLPEDPAERALLLLNFLGMQVLPLLYLVTPWLDFANYELPAVWGWVGVALFVFAQWIIGRSHADLGRNWTMAPEVGEAHRLVTEGVYRHIRHPMYSGHLLWALAQPLLLWNWLAGFSFLAASLALVVVRIPREERLMLTHFGDDYAAYRNRTGALLPRWRE